MKETKTMTTLTNLTPHAITLRADGTDTVLAPSGTVARVSSTPGALETVEGCPVPVAGMQVFGGVEGLPEPTPGTMFVVSAMVLAALRGSRPDVVGPGTGPNDNAVRNDKGHVVAVTRLVRG
jgi:hypothetical protein